MKKRYSKEEAFPYLLKVGGLFFALGGMISGVMSMMIMSIKSFFHIRKKVDNALGKRYVELKVKN